MLDTLRRRRDGRAGRDTFVHRSEAHPARRLRSWHLDAVRRRLVNARHHAKNKKKHNATACEHIEGRGDPCKFVRENCRDVAHAIDYLRLMYCDGVNTSPSANPLVVVSLVLWLLMLLSLLGVTAEFFFTEQLDYASRRLGLSDDVAGATLMALGNGAGRLHGLERIHQASDLPLVLAELLGASIFITTVVLGSVLLASSSATNVSPKPFARDVTMLSASAFTIACFCLDGGWTLWSPAPSSCCIWICLRRCVLSHDLIRQRLGRRERVTIVRNTKCAARVTEVRWTGRGAGRPKWN